VFNFLGAASCQVLELGVFTKTSLLEYTSLHFLGIDLFLMM